MTTPDQRNDRERAFFNERQSTRKDSLLDRFYLFHESHRRYFELVQSDCGGTRVLEYGCGGGSSAFLLAERGAHVTGIDISDLAIDAARAEAVRRELSIEFQVADAEALPFEDNSFDLICGSGILHHLDISKALEEILRTLKPGGRAVFIEPLGHNPLFRLYRKVTPGAHTIDEHPLMMDDLRTFERRFSSSRAQYFDLLSLFSIPLLPLRIGPRVMRWLERADQSVFRTAGWLRPYAGFVVLEVVGPLV